VITLARLDHWVLTVQSLENTIDWYTRVLGMGVVTFGDNRKALTFGEQKINLHLLGHEFEPKARQPTSGSADLCFVINGTLEAILHHLTQSGVTVEEGPVPRTGALGPIQSVYVRDPDGNLIELSVY